MSLQKIEHFNLKKIIIFLCILPLIITALGIFYTIELQDVLYTNMRKNIHDRALHAAKVSKNRLKKTAVTLEKLTSRPYIYSSKVHPNTKVAILQGEMEKHNWEDMIIIDLQGNGHSVKGREYTLKDREYFKKALSGEPYISSIINQNNGPYVAHAVPVYENSKIVGVLAAIELAINTHFSHDETMNIEDGEKIFFVDKKGNYADAGRIRDSSIYSSITTNQSDFFFNNKFLDFFQGLHAPTLFRGEESFISKVPIESTNWHVVGIMPTHKSMEGVGNLWHFSRAFLTCLLVVLMFCIVYLVRMRKSYGHFKNIVSAVIDSQNIFYLDIDEKGLVHYANGCFYKNLNWHNPDFALPLLEYTPSMTVNDLQRHLKQGENFILEVKPKYGLAFKMQCTVIPKKESKGLWILLGSDISSQQSAMEMKLIARQTAELQQIINAVPHSIMVHSAEGIRFANRQTLESLGVTEVNDIRNAIRNGMDAQTFEKQLSMVAHVLKFGQSQTSVFEFTSIHNEKHFMRNIQSPVYDDDGRVKYAVNTSIDITQNMKLQMQLEDELQRLHEILDSSPSGFLYTCDHIVKYCNPAMHKMGRTIEIGNYLPLQEIGIEEDVNRLVAQVESGINVYDLPLEILGKDGLKRYLNISIIGTTWFGKWHNMVWAHDVTAIKSVQNELIIAKEAAEKGAKAKSDFLATMSHEIRTPMNAVLGFLHVFDKNNLNQTQLDYIEKISISAKGLLRIINDILDFSKIEANKMTLEMVPFNLLSSIDAVYSITHFTAKEKELDFYRSIDQDVPKIILGDGERLNQVLLNLLSNAIKFTEKGQVSLDVKVKQKISPTQYILDFVISDTGIGLSQEQAKNLFKPFTQADTSTSRKFGGTGLGLVISQRIIELMGGKISLQSSLGQGAVFTCTLPVQIVENDTKNQNNVKSTPHSEVDAYKLLSGKRVLVVEDNLINQEIAAAMMEEFDLILDFANHGQEALEVVQQKEFDLIFMDLQMPIMNGLDAAQAIRNLGQPYFQQIPIVAMTANVMQEDVNACREAGMNAHIGKPISPKTLRQTLLRWIANTDVSGE